MNLLKTPGLEVAEISGKRKKNMLTDEESRTLFLSFIVSVFVFLELNLC